MQVRSIVLVVEIGLAVLVLIAAVSGYRVGRRAKDPSRALLVVSLASVAEAIVLLAITRGTAAKYGPIVTRQTLLLCFSLGLALIGGCGVGLSRRKGRNSGVIAAGVVTVALIASLLGFFYSRIHEVLEAAGSIGGLERTAAYEPAKNKDCPENLKSLYIAFQQYSLDWDALPPAANWMSNDDLTSKVRQNEWLHCPAISNRHDDRFGYAYNDQVAGRKLNGKSHLADVPDAARTPLLYDSINLAKGAHDANVSLPKPGRHSGRNNILYLDGHVEAIAPK